MAPHIVAGTFEADPMLHTCTTNTFVLLEGVVLVAVEGDGATANQMKGWGLNLAMLPREILYLLQDGVTAELCAREGNTL